MTFLSRFLFFLSVLAIEYLATTSLEIKSIENSWDKANHFVAFFVLYVLFAFGFKSFSIFQRFLLLLLFGLQIEIIQAFLPFREFSILDIFADFIGIVGGLVAMKVLKIRISY